MKVPVNFDQMLEANQIEYTSVEAHGQTFRLASVSSADMLEWLEENDDKDKKKRAGLRLLVKSLVNEENERVPENRRDEFVANFERKNAKGNGALVREALILNGLRKKAEEQKAADTAAKNE